MKGGKRVNHPEMTEWDPQLTQGRNKGGIWQNWRDWVKTNGWKCLLLRYVLRPQNSLLQEVN